MAVVEYKWVWEKSLSTNCFRSTCEWNPEPLIFTRIVCVYHLPLSVRRIYQTMPRVCWYLGELMTFFFLTLFAYRYSAVSPSAVKRRRAVVWVSWCSVINAFLQASSVLANEHCFCFVCVKLHFIDSVLPSLLIPVVWCKKTNPTAPVNVVIMKYCTMALVKSCTLPFRRHSAKLINYYITAVFSLCFHLWSCQPT